MKSHNEARGLEEAAQEDWKRMYKKNHAEIALLFVDEKQKVEFFFKIVEDKRKKAAKKGDGSEGEK